jgi:hypothetical protein
MFRSETKARCTLDEMTCINIVLLVSNTHIFFLLYILIMDILIQSSVLGRIYITHYLIAMAWSIKNIVKGLLGGSKVLICLWLVTLLVLSSGRNPFAPHALLPSY